MLEFLNNERYNKIANGIWVGLGIYIFLLVSTIIFYININLFSNVMWLSGGVLISIVMSVWISINQSKKLFLEKKELGKCLKEISDQSRSQWVGVKPKIYGYK